MAIRDAIVLNTTGSNFEALQSGDTVRVQGDLLVQDSSGTSLLSVGTSDTTVTLGGSVTSSAVISGSFNSTASFGRFVATTYTGDAREIASTLPRSAGIISGAGSDSKYGIFPVISNGKRFEALFPLIGNSKFSEL